MIGKIIGVVTKGQGQRWYNATLTGRESHAGTTPMHLRKDALTAASVSSPAWVESAAQRGRAPSAAIISSSAAPGLGEHTEEVLAELGYTEAEIAGFRETGAIRTAKGDHP